MQALTRVRTQMIRLHCPNTVDYVKLCAAVTCKSMSNGYYKLKCACLHGQGRVKYGHSFALPRVLQPGYLAIDDGGEATP